MTEPDSLAERWAALVAARIAELSAPAAKPEPAAFCERYTYREGTAGAYPCLRCDGAPNAHILHDVKARLQRKRGARLLRVHVPRRPVDERIPSAILIRRSDPIFGGVYRRLRLACPASSCPGYFVVRSRADRRFKFAGCSTYRETGCRASLTSWQYVIDKALCVEAILAEQSPPFPIRFVTPKPRAPKVAVPCP